MGKRSSGTRDRARRRSSSWQLEAKYLLDFIGAVLLLIVLLPALLVITGAVWVEMGRPVLFRQLRVGRDGKRFEILKFRTMKKAAESELDVAEDACVGCDTARISSVGRFLRATSLDELPQLINILRGEMSFVGPRPERPILVERFIAQIPDYDRRHRARSGITGWAQIQGAGRGPDRFSTEDLSDRIRLDNHYIDHWSLWLDVKIVLLTLPAVIRFPQVRAPSPTSVDSDVSVSEMEPTEAREPSTIA